MRQEDIYSTRLDDEYVKIEHDSGLTMLLCPMKGFSTSFALFSTEYGSIDVSFKTDKEDDFVTVPAGIAHYLEHKLFESEDKDAFERYAKTGASANAYTSFDKTAYLFGCSENFKESLEILLDFVTSPYFTEETVRKEQGIIGQEIRMYDDDPQWRVMVNLLEAAYKNNPVKTDIAGTVESIAKINADLLYRCYNTFYNLNNMVLTIAGNFKVEDVLEVADRILKKSEDVKVIRMPVEEPDDVCTRRVEAVLPVSMPLFNIGIKHKASDKLENARTQLVDEIILDVIAGESSPLYRRLYDSGLINSSFAAESFVGRDYVMSLFMGESKDPDEVNRQIMDEIENAKSNGMDEELFSTAKKSLYGKYLSAFSTPEGVASMMQAAHMYGFEMYSMLEEIASITLEDAQKRLTDAFDTQKSVLSIIKSADTEQR